MSQGENDNSNKILPKYTLEKMLISYFLQSQKAESINSFYKRIAEKFEGSANDYDKLTENIEALNIRNKILKTLRNSDNSLYKNTPY